MPANTAGYQAEYRKRNPKYQKRQKALEKARHEAWRLLAERYPQEYAQLLREIHAREGL